AARQRRAPPLGAVFHAKNKREWGAFIQRLKALGFPRPRQLIRASPYSLLQVFFHHFDNFLFLARV
ncbi:MAG: hypothetical protein WCY41_06285, partial [Candidatus Micrarchaeia archaeon]